MLKDEQTHLNTACTVASAGVHQHGECLDYIPVMSPIAGELILIKDSVPTWCSCSLEGAMRTWDAVRRLPGMVGSRSRLNLLAARRRQADFMCRDCERWQRCGLPPDGNCVARAEQLARHDGRAPRRTSLRDWTAWGY